LFWFFGYFEVYIIVLLFFGIISEIMLVFSCKLLFGYKGMVFVMIVIVVLLVMVWVYYMYVIG